MAQCFEESHTAYAAGDGARAKELSNQGKAHKAEMERLNAQASEWIFASASMSLSFARRGCGVLGHWILTTYDLSGANREQRSGCMRRFGTHVVGLTGVLQDSAPEEVDLHGLYVKEAITYSERAINDARRRGDAKVHLIVGTPPCSVMVSPS